MKDLKREATNVMRQQSREVFEEQEEDEYNDESSKAYEKHKKSANKQVIIANVKPAPKRRVSLNSKYTILILDFHFILIILFVHYVGDACC